MPAWHGDLCRFHVWVAVLYLCLDYLLSTAALCFVTAKQAPGSRRDSSGEASWVCLVGSITLNIWQCVKTNSTPSVHIKIAGIYGCSFP